MANLKDLMEETAEHMGARPLTPQVGAYSGTAETDGESFFYDAHFMQHIESLAGEDGVRFVVAHEMGHQVGGMHNGGHDGEFMADEFAARAMASMGADFDAIASVFSFLDAPGSETHPSTSSRSSRARGVYQAARGEALADEADWDDSADKKKLKERDRDLDAEW